MNLQKYLFFSFFFVSNIAFSQSFYAEKTVQNIEIKFAFDDWDFRMDTAAVGKEGYTVALWCKINGQKFDSIGVKFKGNSSYKVSNKKNPLHISLDFKKNQDYQGFTDVKLTNVFADPTFVREPLSYDVLRKYTDVPDCNQAKVTINGQFYGVMTNTESINKNFLKNHFTSNEGVFFKCNPSAPPAGSQVLPSLVFLGKDSTKYYEGYELKSKTGWSKLVNLVDTLTNQPNLVGKHIDIDRALWMLAFNNLFVNLDSYTGAFAQNYYLYQDDTKRFLPIVWDLNLSFGGFTRTGESPTLAIADLPKLKLFLHENSANRPLIQQLFANATFRKMYVAKMRTMAKENLSNGAYFQKAAAMQSLIDSLVQKDSNKFFTYQQFKDNLTQSASGAGAGGTAGVVPGLKSLMDARLTFLNGEAAFTAVPPKIDTVIVPKVVNINTKAIVLAKISNATSAFLNYRFEKKGVFTKIQLFDDGKNGDGAANDGTFGASFLLKQNATYYVYAENATAGMFSPERAEYEFYTLKANLPNAVKLKYNELTINEVVASNTKTTKDEAGQFEDYIEIKNNTTKNIDLTSVFLSDDAKNPYKWNFNVGTTIAPNSYQLVWADEDSSQGNTHANFKLSNNGEKIFLTAPDSVLLDTLRFPKLKDDAAYARCPDGKGAFKIVNPTPKSFNSCHPVGLENTENQLFIKIYPNPAQDFFNIETAETESKNKIQIFNLLGQLVFEKNAERQLQVTTNTWQQGIYLVKYGNLMRKVSVEK